MGEDVKVLIILAIVVFSSVGGLFYIIGVRDHKVIEGNIINTESILNDDGSMNYLLLHFDNGEKYKVKFIGDDYRDLTKGSKLIIELSILHYAPQLEYGNDIWVVDGIIKVPENPGVIE